MIRARYRMPHRIRSSPQLCSIIKHPFAMVVLVFILLLGSLGWAQQTPLAGQLIQALEGRPWQFIVTSMDGDLCGYAFRDGNRLELSLAPHTPSEFYIAFFARGESIRFDDGNITALRGYLDGSDNDATIYVNGILRDKEVFPLSEGHINLNNLFKESALYTHLQVRLEL